MKQMTRAGGGQTGALAHARRAAAAEWGVLFTVVRETVVAKRLAAVPLACTATALVMLFGIVQHLPGGERFVTHIGVVKAALPLDISLLRTPLSLYVPALDLPVWGALAQVFFVFGIAEIVLGRRMTLVVAYVCTLAGTLFARIGVALGPGHLLGLHHLDAYVRDTGPSAAVVALAVCVAFRCRAWWTGGTVALVMIVEAVLLPNLAGLEHLVALVTAMLIAGSVEVFGDFWPRVLGGVGAAASIATEATRRTAAGALTP
ncbi:hypothetical protein [Saccharothrix sp. ST-888]|uniref:hypothetical protein n=1 Tax=Saccharothrix sp. ST-888 TaxID=1427391 RepID=UPI0018CE36AC|nr:hypothetical protein [Saccharothrix sp. ST-888]